jgi:hypothetical protein
MWLLVAAVAIPLVIGRLIAAKSIYLSAAHFFIISYYAALFVFAIGVPWLASAVAFSAFALRAHGNRFHLILMRTRSQQLIQFVAEQNCDE